MEDWKRSELPIESITLRKGCILCVEYAFFFYINLLDFITRVLYLCPRGKFIQKQSSSKEKEENTVDSTRNEEKLKCFKERMNCRMLLLGMDLCSHLVGKKPCNSVPFSILQLWSWNAFLASWKTFNTEYIGGILVSWNNLQCHKSQHHQQSSCISI